MQDNIAIIGMFFITLITRVGFLFLTKPLKVNLKWQYILRLAPAVALAATVMLDTFFYKNNFLGIMHNTKLFAVLIAIAFFIYFKKVWLSLIAGIAVWCIFIALGLI